MLKLSRMRSRPAPPERSFGSKSGLLYIARRRPVRTSTTTAEPAACGRIARSIACTRSMSMVRRRSRPESGSCARRRVEEALGLGPGAVAAARVDDALLPAALPAEVALPRALDAGGADDVARVVAERVRLLPLLGGHALPARRAGSARASRRRSRRCSRASARRGACTGSSGSAGSTTSQPGSSVGVLLQLGDDVAREVLAHEDRRASTASDPRRWCRRP